MQTPWYFVQFCNHLTYVFPKEENSEYLTFLPLFILLMFIAAA